MSLINDALKKAQRQRTGEPAPSPLSAPPMPGGSPAPLRSAPKKDPSPTLILVGAGLTVGLLVGGGAFWFLSGSTEKTAAKPAPTTTAPAITASANPAPAPAAAASTATPTATVSQPVAAAPTVALKLPESTTTQSTPKENAAPVLPPTTAATTAPAPSVQLPAVAPAAAPAAEPATVAVAVTPPANPAPAISSATAKPAGPAEPSEQMVKAIEGFRIMGIRAAGGADAKVLMNDRVFRIGDLVDRALGIRLTAATANSLTFQDNSGATYTRNF